MKERNRSIDAIKGVAIVLVMIGHVFVHNRMEDPYIYDFIKAVQMPLFMIVSGYLCGQGRKITDLKTYGKVMGKRAAAYLLPFFSWLTLLHWDNLIEAYKRVAFELDFGLWFLAVLFILTFMVYTAQLVSAKFREKREILSELLFWSTYGAFCFVLLMQCLVGNRFLSPSLTLLYVPFYMLGYVTGNYGKNFLNRTKSKGCKIDYKNEWYVRSGMYACTLIFLYLVITKNLNSMETKIDILVQMLASFLGSAAIILSVLRWKEGRIKSFFANIGLYTLEIYVVHYHFADILNFNGELYDFYTLQGVSFVLISFVAMCAITFVCVWMMKKVKILDFLFFGK